MRWLGYSCLALYVATASIAAAKPTLLQTVNLEGMSTEGGEARLYRANKAAIASCKIEVIHYGETGKTTFVFVFGSRLHSATRTEYRYNAPIYVTNGGRVASTHSVTLQNAEGRKRLPTDFAEYRGLFDPGKLAKCRTS